MQNCKTSRRQILKTFGLGTVFSAAGGATWTGLMLAEVKTQAALVLNPLRFKLADFPALAKTNGSIRIGSSAIGGNTPDYPDGLYYPIVITRGTGNTFYAVDTQCTHAGCVVNTYDSKTGRIMCPCHGSTYDVTGRVMSGPAKSNLTAFPARLDVETNNVVVDAKFDQDQNLSIEQYELLSSGAKRIALEWTAFPSVNYEIRFKPTVKSPSEVAKFALTQNGPAEETFLAGTGDVTRVWVDRPATSGFFQVAFNYSEV